MGEGRKRMAVMMMVMMVMMIITLVETDNINVHFRYAPVFCIVFYLHYSHFSSKSRVNSSSYVN